MMNARDLEARCAAVFDVAERSIDRHLGTARAVVLAAVRMEARSISNRCSRNPLPAELEALALRLDSLEEETALEAR